eukprot:g12738.t1
MYVFELLIFNVMCLHVRIYKSYLHTVCGIDSCEDNSKVPNSPQYNYAQAIVTQMRPKPRPSRMVVLTTCFLEKLQSHNTRLSKKIPNLQPVVTVIEVEGHDCKGKLALPYPIIFKEPWVGVKKESLGRQLSAGCYMHITKAASDWVVFDH